MITDSATDERFARFLAVYIFLPMLSGMACSFFSWAVILPLLCAWWLVMSLFVSSPGVDYEIGWLIVLASFTFSIGYLIGVAVHTVV